MNNSCSTSGTSCVTVVNNPAQFNQATRGAGGSVSKVVESNCSYKPITNMVWVRSQFCKLRKRLHSTRSASDKVCQLLAYGRWFCLGTPASSTTTIGRHKIAEILLKLALNTMKKTKKNSQTLI